MGDQPGSLGAAWESSQGSAQEPKVLLLASKTARSTRFARLWSPLSSYLGAAWEQLGSSLAAAWEQLGSSLAADVPGSLGVAWGMSVGAAGEQLGRAARDLLRIQRSR